MNVVELQRWFTQYACLRKSRPLVLAILNVTPDSFADQGRYFSRDRAFLRAMEIIRQGADLIDIGAESTRPGATPVSLDCELERVIPLIERIRQHSDIAISIDTYKPDLMRAAVAAGANMINDVYALQQDGALAVAASLDVPICLMHMKGQPQSMQSNPNYPLGVLEEVLAFFNARLEACAQAGIARERIILDPGIGFGKNTQNNLYLINQIVRLSVFDCPLLLGVSRKSMIGAILDQPVEKRMAASLALAIFGVLQGVSMIRAHDVEETVQALKIIEAVDAATYSEGV